MTREVIESLDCVSCVRMVGETIRRCAEQIFEDMDSSLVILMMRGHILGGNEGESRGCIRMCAGGKPVNRANNPLVYFSISFEIEIL